LEKAFLLILLIAFRKCKIKKKGKEKKRIAEFQEAVFV